MNVNSDGAEIDAARDMEVYGDWIRFVDGEGSIVKIDPEVVKQLMDFVTANKVEISEAPAPNLQIRAFLDGLKDRIVKRYDGGPLDQDYAYGMEIVYFELIDLIEGKK